jgi:hypothetical protein
MSSGIKEDLYAAEEVQAGRDRRKAAAGRCAGLAGSEYGGCDPSYQNGMELGAGSSVNTISVEYVMACPRGETEC